MKCKSVKPFHRFPLSQLLRVRQDSPSSFILRLSSSRGIGSPEDLRAALSEPDPSVTLPSRHDMASVTAASDR